MGKYSRVNQTYVARINFDCICSISHVSADLKEICIDLWQWSVENMFSGLVSVGLAVASPVSLTVGSGFGSVLLFIKFYKNESF